MSDVQKYLLEAEIQVGKNYFNSDKSTFLLVPDSDLEYEYANLRHDLQKNGSDQSHFIARKWSSIAVDKTQPNDNYPLIANSLKLSCIKFLRNNRYLLPDLSPQDLVQFPEKTLGGAYLQYMNDARFYEFDKNPLSPDCDLNWLIRLMRQTHDFYHLVGEFYHYGWEGGYLVYNDPKRFNQDMLVLIEEICIYAFIMGQVRLKEVIPIVADWANHGYGHCASWLNQAYPIWRDTKDFGKVADFAFHRFIGDCEKYTYASMKLDRLEAAICIDDYLDEINRMLPPLAINTSWEEREARDMVLESFERGLRSKPLICFEWDKYLANDLDDIRAFLNIPRRKLFREGSHYLQADVGPDSPPIPALAV